MEEGLWLEKAQEDFDTAEFNRKNGKLPYAAFLYQQAIEKGLKAILIKKKTGLPRIHDCFLLAKRAGAPDIIIQKADVLSPYYSRTRYPDVEIVTLTKDEIQRIGTTAKEVLEWIKKNC